MRICLGLRVPESLGDRLMDGGAGGQERSLKKTAQRLLLAQLKKQHLLSGKVTGHMSLDSQPSTPCGRKEED